MHDPTAFAAPEDPPVHWHYDRAIEALVFLDRTEAAAGRANVAAWSRRVWEPARFTALSVRALPPAPPEVHGALLHDTRWR
jgi:hypothetical protein